VKIPVIGNGDILTPEDAVRMVAETDCDAVMIAARPRPTPGSFRQIEQYLSIRRLRQPTHQDRYEMMRTYYAMLIARAERDAVGKMKTVCHLLHAPASAGRALRSIYIIARKPGEILDLVDAFFRADRALGSEPTIRVQTGARRSLVKLRRRALERIRRHTRAREYVRACD